MGASAAAGDAAGALPEAQQARAYPPTATQRMRDLNARRAQFATIRTVKAVRKEIEEHQPDAYLQQITDYKRLRRQQQKEVKQLEEKQTLEMEQLRVRLDREYQQLLKGFTKELEKLHTQHQQYLEQKARGQEDVERRAWKQMKEQQQGDTKALIAHQKKQLKQHRDRLKQVRVTELAEHKAHLSGGGGDWGAMAKDRFLLVFMQTLVSGGLLRPLKKTPIAFVEREKGHPYPLDA